jgi:hypothetical protein
LAKKPNYNFEKRRKELDKKAKKEQKKQRRLELTQAKSEEPGADVPDEGSPGANE